MWILQIEEKRIGGSLRSRVFKKLVSTVCFPPGVMVQKLPWATIERPEESRFLHTVMRPGDMLYMPKGVWHRASAVGGSMALTLGNCGYSTDVIQHAIGPRFQNSTSFQDPLPGFWSGGGHFCGRNSTGVATSFEDSLEQLQMMVKALTPADYIRPGGKAK